MAVTELYSLTPPCNVIQIIESSQRALILSHHNPDGDALGSAMALALTMKHEGRQADLHLAGAWSDHLSFLLNQISVNEDFSSLETYDLIVLLDCHHFDRLGDQSSGRLKELLAKLSSQPKLVVIDHHLLGSGEEVGPNWFLRSDASSTGELVWEVIKALGWSAPKEALDGLLMAMASDTNFFVQSNTKGSTLRATGDMIDLGGDLNGIYTRLRLNQPLRRLKLMGLAIDSLTTHFGGRLATLLVTPDSLARAGASFSDTEDFVDIGRSLAGVKISALIKDSGQGAGAIRVSLRGDGVDVRVLAQAFQGGGHREAAAYNDLTAATAQEALEHLLAKVEPYL